MEIVKWFIEFILHMDTKLSEIVALMGFWSYGILFLVIFVETGVVIMPFLPGDSLLFAAGALAAGGSLNVFGLFALLAVAAVVGDTANYWIGYYIGPRVFSEKIPFLKKEYLDRTHAFYEKHGGKTIFLARFIPIIRTFAPFVAGVGLMSYGYFITYNVVGGLVWTALFTFGGYFFGNLPIVKDNFSFVIIAIILISALPAVYEIIQARRPVAKPPASATPLSQPEK